MPQPQSVVALHSLSCSLASKLRASAVAVNYLGRTERGEQRRMGDVYIMENNP